MSLLGHEIQQLLNSITFIGSMSDVLVILAIPRFVSSFRITPLRSRPLEPLKRLNDREELRRWQHESYLNRVAISHQILVGSFSRPSRCVMMIDLYRIFMLMLSLPILSVATLFSSIPTVVHGLTLQRLFVWLRRPCHPRAWCTSSPFGTSRQ